MEEFVQCSANYEPLSPISFLERASVVYGNSDSVIYGESTRFSWRQTYERCLRLASSLLRMGINHGDVVVALAPNVPALYELYFGVPMAGAILSALNPKLDPSTLSLLLQELNPKAIFVDYEFIEPVLEALQHLSPPSQNSPLLVIIPECDIAKLPTMIPKTPQGSLIYEEVLEMGRDRFEIIRPTNECNPISVNYTSGSTGKPKGVVYSHRAVYLTTLSVIFRANMRPTPAFLWTVDMFRCNGWCFIWAVAALGGTNICVRNVTSDVIFDSIRHHEVTHLYGAPSLLQLVADAPEIHHRPLPHPVKIAVAGLLPPSKTLKKVRELGFDISHAYGMTEALGPVIFKSLDPEGDADSTCTGTSPTNNHDFRIMGPREGTHSFMIEGVDVKDPKTMTSVPRDGKTLGEVMFRGNTVMSGYLKNPEATREAFSNGWYKTGDLGVRHRDGYIQMKDRIVDKIISSQGETISSIEIESVIASHPSVKAAAVIGRREDRPCAFVELTEGCNASAEEIVEFCGDRLTHYMVPRRVVFGDLPVNSAGKIQKFVLRERAESESVDNFSCPNGI